MSDEESNNINITYQTLFELFRRESSREGLQELDPDFFLNVVDYVKEKKESIVNQRKKEDLFAEEEGKKAEFEFDSIRKIIKKLYEIRENKIINIAIDASRTEGDIVDTSSMLPEEKVFYDKLVISLKDFRKGVLLKVIEGNNPDIKVKREKKEKKTDKHSVIEPDSDIEDSYYENAPDVSKSKESKSKSSSKDASENKKDSELLEVKFLEDMPEFVGEDLEEYGPFSKGDKTNLPPQITDILLQRKVIEKI